MGSNLFIKTSEEFHNLFYCFFFFFPEALIKKKKKIIFEESWDIHIGGSAEWITEWPRLVVTSEVFLFSHNFTIISLIVKKMFLVNKMLLKHYQNEQVKWDLFNHSTLQRLVSIRIQQILWRNITWNDWVSWDSKIRGYVTPEVQNLAVTSQKGREDQRSPTPDIGLNEHLMLSPGPLQSRPRTTSSSNKAMKLWGRMML